MIILANDYEANIPGSTKHGTGGPARFAKQLASAITKAGHSYIGIVVSSANIKRPMVKEAGSMGRINYLRLRFSNEEYRSVTLSNKPVDPHKAMASSVLAYRQIIQSVQPDIVFINGFDLRVWSLMIAAYTEGVPIVQKHAGIWHKELDAYQHLYTKTSLRIMKAMEKSIPQYAAKQVFLNDYCEKVFTKEVAKVPKKQSIVIPIPTEFSQQKHRSKKKAGTIHIGIVARWDRIKNHDAILALAEEIERQGLDMKIHAITKIPKTKKFLDFKRRYKQLIDVQPHTDTKGIMKFFRSMDIALLPSHFETAGFVVLEAATQGIGTIISQHVGWINDYRSTGNKDWVGDFTKPKTIVKKITKLAGQPLSSVLLERFKNDHSPKRVFTEYLKLFKTITSTN